MQTTLFSKTTHNVLLLCGFAACLFAASPVPEQQACPMQFLGRPNHRCPVQLLNSIYGPIRTCTKNPDLAWKI